MEKEDEYREIFMAEALDNYEELNRLITELEKKPTNTSVINAVFRITHTLKGNAAGMGFSGIAELSHVIETLFGEVRSQRLNVTSDIFAALFKAIDVLGALIRSLQDGSKVSYKGIKTKLEVICRQATTEESKSSSTANSRSKKTKKASPASKRKPKSSSKKEKPTSPSVDEVEKSDKPEPTSEATATKPNTDTSLSKEVGPENNIIFSDLVQVPVRKLDNLLNLVGELIIERDRMMASNAELHRANEYARLNRISSDLQYSVMDVRLVQVGFLFKKFHRVVRDAAALEKKQVTLVLVFHQV